MPVNQSLMDALVKRYGQERGERTYNAMEREGKVVAKGGHMPDTKPPKRKVAKFKKGH
jgi:hypothetical protein